MERGLPGQERRDLAEIDGHGTSGCQVSYIERLCDRFQLT